MSEQQPINFIPLEAIDPNPYNCRLSEDPEHVKKVALSIAAEGLMQFPIGRLVGGTIPDGEEELRGNSVEMLLKGGHRVQLAFGHTRLAAYKLLKDAGNKGFDTLPMIIRRLTDEDMFRQGASENLARKDLTAIEEATAMKRYRDEFHKTSVEIGELFNLNESSVRNKIRLLGLPEDIQQKLSERYLSESAARALLELFELPIELRDKGEKQYQPDYRPSLIVERALNGIPADRLLENISGLIRNYSEDLSKANWKFDEVIAGEYIRGICKGCQFKVANDKKNFCMDAKCFYAKKFALNRRYLEQASLLAGIPVFEGDSDSSTTKFERGRKDDALNLGKSIKCPNLRLIYVDYDYYSDDSDHLKELGFPRAQIVCGKQQQWCSCIAAVKAGLKDMLVEKAAEPEYVPVEDSADPGAPVVIPSSIAVTMDQLKAVSKAARQQKKETLEEIKAMTVDAGKVIAKGLLDINNPRIWLEILRKINYGPANDIDKESKGDFSDDPIAWCDEIRLALGMAIAQQTGAENYYYSEPKWEESLVRLNNFLKRAGLQELEYGVSTETVKGA